MASPPFIVTSSNIDLFSVQTTTLPMFAFLALLTTCEIMDKLLIFNNGLPGNLVADILEGIKIIVLGII